MDAISRSRAAVAALVAASAFLMSCDKILDIHEVTPYPENPAERPHAGIGNFASGFAAGSKDGIQLEGALFWNGAVQGAKDGIAIAGSIR